MENDVVAALCMLLDGKSEHGLYIEYPAPDITWERRRVNLTDLNGSFWKVRLIEEDCRARMWEA